MRAADSPSARSSGIYSKPVELGHLVRVCASMCAIQFQLSLALKAAYSSFILTDNIVSKSNSYNILIYWFWSVASTKHCTGFSSEIGTKLRD